MDTDHSKHLLRTVFDVSPVGIAIADREGRILEANPAFRARLGYSLKELQQMRWVDIAHPHDRTMLLERVQSMCEGRTDAWQTLKCCVAKGGRETRSLARFTALRDESGDILHWLGVLEDVSDCVSAHDEPERSPAHRDQQTPTPQAARSPARRIAHDLNNLLMAIQGNISLLLLNKDLNLQDVGYLKKMEASVAEASELTRQIQDWLRQEYPDIKSVDPKSGFMSPGGEKDRESTVSIFAPASERPATPDNRPLQTARPSLKTILLVEDEEMVVDIGRQMLERLGYRALVARTGQDALSLYEKRHRDIDLVILDMIMPGMGGGDVFARLKAVNPEVAVLLASGFILNGQAREILDSGCKGFIQKPFSLEQLSFKIREVLPDE